MRNGRASKKEEKERTSSTKTRRKPRKINATVNLLSTSEERKKALRSRSETSAPRHKSTVIPIGRFSLPKRKKPTDDEKGEEAISIWVEKGRNFGKSLSKIKRGNRPSNGSLFRRKKKREKKGLFRVRRKGACSCEGKRRKTPAGKLEESARLN